MFACGCFGVCLTVFTHVCLCVSIFCACCMGLHVYGTFIYVYLYVYEHVCLCACVYVLCAPCSCVSVFQHLEACLHVCGMGWAWGEEGPGRTERSGQGWWELSDACHSTKSAPGVGIRLAW